MVSYLLELPFQPWLVTSFGDLTADILLQSFKDSFTPVDLSTINEALLCQTGYSQQLAARLMNLFSRFDCLEMPKPGNILRLCQQSCRYMCIDKPFSAIVEIKKGIPYSHQRFWDKKGVSGLYQLYMALTVSPAKILQCIQEPVVAEPADQRVFDNL